MICYEYIFILVPFSSEYTILLLCLITTNFKNKSGKNIQ